MIAGQCLREVPEYLVFDHILFDFGPRAQNEGLYFTLVGTSYNPEITVFSPVAAPAVGNSLQKKWKLRSRM